MRLPRIKTRMANILAKLAGSEDYDPKVKPLTPAEYYADQIPVIPKPSASDEGMPLVADAKGGYTFGESDEKSNVLAIYVNPQNMKGYLNKELTETFNTYQETKAAIEQADLIILKPVAEPSDYEIISSRIGMGIFTIPGTTAVPESVSVSIDPWNEQTTRVTLWEKDLP